MDQENLEPNTKRVKTKELTDNERIAVVSMLLGMSAKGPLPHGSFIDVAKKFEVQPRGIGELWAKATTSRLKGKVDEEEIKSKRHERGRKMLWDIDAMDEAVQQIPCSMKTSYHGMAAHIGVPKTTLLRYRKEFLVRHSNALKPTLTPEHKAARLEFAMSKVDPNTVRNGSRPKYLPMLDEVHVDEKWFHMTKDNRVFILSKNEEPPKRTVQHKCYIGKVMFLCAQARPRMVDDRMWDGKIGIWPFGYVGEAQRRSKHRPRGAPVWKNESVKQEVYRRYMLDKVIPAIIDKFPMRYLKEGVKIQQDGSTAHLPEGDEEWNEAMDILKRESRINIKLYTQPAQSPDTNINDLAFFRSIQTLYYEAAPTTEFALIKAVEDAYWKYPANKLNRMWLTYQSCLNMIIEHEGDNFYSIPHMNKEGLEKTGQLPKVLDVTEVAFPSLELIQMQTEAGRRRSNRITGSNGSAEEQQQEQQQHG
jgi:hypothetical protein